MGYTKLEYIQSTGVQYIDTELTPNPNYSIEVSFMVSQFTTNWDTIFGTRNGSYSRFTARFRNNIDGVLGLQYSSSGSGEAILYNTSLTKTSFSNKFHIIKYEKNNIYIDNELIYTFNEPVDNISYPYNLYLFANNAGAAGDFGYLKISYCKIWNDQELVRDFIPALDENDIPCMYDNISNMFFYNKGTGIFLTNNNTINSEHSLPEEKLNLNNWIKNMDSFPVFENVYEYGINTLNYQGGGGYERIYIPIEVKKNRIYKFKFKLYSPTGFNIGDYGNNYAFAFVRTTAPADADGALSKTNLAYSEQWDNSISNTPKQYTITFNSGDNTILYVAFDFGYILDGETLQFIFSDFKLDNGVQKPTEYLKYVESDGTQYINLNYIHTENTKIELKCRVIKNNQRTWEALFGSRYKNYQNNAFVFFTKTNGNDIPIYNRSGHETQGTNFIYDEDIILTCYQQLSTWITKDGTVYNLTAQGTVNNGIAPILLFDLNNAQSSNTINPDNSRSVMRVFSLKIYEGDILVRYYRPALDSQKNAYLFEEIEKEAYYPAIGNSLTYAYNDGYYLIRNNTNIYSIINGELTLLQETVVNSDLFKNYGIGEAPDWFYIRNLINPEVLYWQSKADNIPKLIANMKATPLHQNIITNPIDLTDASIKGIESITINCEGNPLFAISFDKIIWKAWDGENWIVLSENFSGMSKEILEAITVDNWKTLLTNSTEMFIRISLTNTNQIIHKIDVDFLN